MICTTHKEDPKEQMAEKSKVDIIVDKLKAREKYTYKEMVNFVTQQKLTPEELQQKLNN